MTTITPEREAELRLSHLRHAWDLHGLYLDTPAGVMDQLEADVELILSSLSTERERAEAELREARAEMGAITGALAAEEANVKLYHHQISALQALIAVKDEALRPFSEKASAYDPTHSGEMTRGGGHAATVTLTIEDFRRARTALNATEAKTGEPG